MDAGEVASTTILPPTMRRENRRTTCRWHGWWQPGKTGLL